MDIKLYHGGVRGLSVGDLLLPPSETGKATLRRNVARDDLAAGHARADRVYVTSDKRAAKVYASIYPNGTLYEVEARGKVEDDPDAPGISWACESARIVRVVETRIKFKKKRLSAWVNSL